MEGDTESIGPVATSTIPLLGTPLEGRTTSPRGEESERRTGLCPGAEQATMHARFFLLSTFASMKLHLGGQGMSGRQRRILAALLQQAA